LFHGGNLYVSSTETDEILRYDAQTGDFLGKFVSAETDSLSGFQLFYLAMANWNFGDRSLARQQYQKGVEWMEKYQPVNDELEYARKVAAEVLGIRP
jgi:hypothetical protein